MKSGSENDRKRWESERAYFDEEEYVEAPLPPQTIRRYLECRKPWLAPEFPFYVLGDLRGRYILEVGCGNGSNAILLALKGARVVGVDISPVAVEIATRRAAMHQVSDRAAFYASPFELFEPPEGKFDVVCGWAVLHHLLPVLDSVLATLTNLAKPGASMMFVEPVAVWKWLRRLRLTLPIHAGGTPDERPLEPPEFAIIGKHLQGLQVTYFNAAVRIVDRFLGARYDGMSPAGRALYDVLARVDPFPLNRLGLRGLASVATFYGRTSAQRDGQ